MRLFPWFYLNKVVENIETVIKETDNQIGLATLISKQTRVTHHLNIYQGHVVFLVTSVVDQRSFVMLYKVLPEKDKLVETDHESGFSTFFYHLIK